VLAVAQESLAQVFPTVRIVGWGDNTYFQTNIPPGLSNVISFASGSGHHLALNSDGTAVSWGRNDLGQINIPPDLSNMVAVAAGPDFSAALTEDGRVTAWGRYGVSIVPPGLESVVAIAAGASHVLALKRDGTVTAWGQNAYGETNVPANLSNVVAIAGGNSFSVAVKVDGTVTAWGLNNYDQTNVPASLTNVVAVAAGDRSAWALRSDGMVVGWGNGLPNAPFGNSVVSIAADSISGGVFQLLANGGILGSNAPANLTNVIAIPTGSYGSIGLALAVNGAMFPFLRVQPVQRTSFVGTSVQFHAEPFGFLPPAYQWQFNGTNLQGATGPVLYLPALRLSDEGTYRALAIGSVNSASVNLSVSLGPPYLLASPSNQFALVGQSASFQVAAGGASPRYHWRHDDVDIPGATNSALFVDNVTIGQAGNYSVLVSNAFGTVTSPSATLAVQQVFGWSGGSVTNVPPNLGSVLAIAASESVHDLALRTDGTVSAWGDSANNLNTVPPGISNIVAIAGGGVHNLLLKMDGTMISWGNSGYNGVTNIPSGIGPVKAIDAGGTHSVALKANGSVIAWGNDDFGAIDVPPNLTNVIAIAAGGNHSLALKNDGTVTAWGESFYGQTNVPPGLANVLAISGGGEHSLALKSDGTVVAWGRNDSTQATVPGGLSNVVAIAGGGTHSVALRNSGSVVAWGTGPNTTNVPAVVVNVTAVSAGINHTLVRLGGGVPAFTIHPFDQVAFAAAPLTFHARAAGSLPMAFQWQVNGTNIPGATNASLLLPNLQLSDAGIYRATVSNSAGGDISRTASLTVLDSLSIGVQPKGQTVLVGENVSLSVAASGVPPLRYQWRFKASDILDATNATLNLNGVQTDQSGDYSVLVSNPVRQLPSETVTLNVKYILAYKGGQVLERSNNFVGPVMIELDEAFPQGSIFYTLNGSAPSFISQPYTGPFMVPTSATLRAIAYSANFSQSIELDQVTIVVKPVYSLSATTSGGGTVSITPADGPYETGTVVNATAMPAAGWAFLGWLGDATGTNPVVSIAIDRNRCVKAVFGTTVGTTVSGAGAVSVFPQAMLYPFGTVLRLTALPEAGNFFGAWGNAAGGNVSPLNFTVTNPVPVISSIFGPLSSSQFALTILVDGRGRVIINPPGNHYNHGQIVTVTALPDAGQSFMTWSGDSSDTQNPLSVLMNQSKAIRANFTRQPRLTLPECPLDVRTEGFRASVDGELGASFTIEKSADLLQWMPLATVSNLLGTVQFQDQPSTNLDQRFYRVVLPQ